MADEKDGVQQDDEPLELTPDMEVDPDAEDQRGEDDNPDPNVNDEDEAAPSVAFEGEEPEAQPDNSTIRTMRQQLREKERELAELRKSAAPKPIEVGPKPDLWEDCEGDPDKFETALDAWKDRKAAAEHQEQSQAEESRKANESWQQDLGSYQQKKAALQFEDAEDTVKAATGALSMVQQAVIVKAANDPALLFYALGKSDGKLAELAKIEDPIKLAAAVARMEGAVKVTPGRKAPPPDKPLKGSGQMPGGTDKELEKLEKKVANGGDRTELIKYKKSKGLIK